MLGPLVIFFWILDPIVQKFYPLTTVGPIFNSKCHLDDLLLFQVRPGDNIVSRTWTPSPWHLPTLIAQIMKSNRSFGTPCEWRKSVRLSCFYLYPRWSTLPNWILPENPILGRLWLSYHELLLSMNISFLFLFMFLMHEFPFFNICLLRKNSYELCNYWK